LETGARNASRRWKALYRAAVLELDRNKSRQRIDVAHSAILRRVEMLKWSDTSKENAELMNALKVLGDLRKIIDRDGKL
jgi:hypothetical protein